MKNIISEKDKKNIDLYNKSKAVEEKLKILEQANCSQTSEYEKLQKSFNLKL